MKSKSKLKADWIDDYYSLKESFEITVEGLQAQLSVEKVKIRDLERILARYETSFRRMAGVE